MTRTFRAVLVAGAALTALTACMTTSKGNPTPAPGATSAAGSTTTSGKPSGGSDLDLGKYLANPCAILTQAQQAELTTFREAKPETTGEQGPSCTYQGKDVLANSTFEITFMVKGTSIDDLIGNTKTGFPVARETKVAGRPAVSFDSADGKRNCSTAFGTSDTEAVLVQGNIGKNDKLNDDNACGTTERVATTIVGNLKG
ncbi:DUF3558 domain-containing protein [Actinosynnema sp. NPDC050436]|uniref:DUF3558 domain-containing protein n=1 Tax=Actinosynnema sp. NPDC050436 TaxID=3155659 RepID=UPI0033F1AF8D